MSVLGVIVSVRFAVAVCTGVLVSVTLKLNGVAFTGAVGVPLIWPVVVLKVSPAGSVPINCQVYGTVPPEAATVTEYATPTWPFGSDVVLIVSGVLAIVIENDALAVATGDAESVTWMIVRLFTTSCVGVPLITPPELSVSPAGKVPEMIAQE